MFVRCTQAAAHHNSFSFLLLNNVNISQCEYTTIYLSYCRWTFGLFSVFGYYKGYYTDTPVHVFWSMCACTSVGKYLQQNCWVTCKDMFSFIRYWDCFPKWLYRFTFLPIGHEKPTCFTSLSTFVIFSLFRFSPSGWCPVTFYYDLNFYFHND